MVHGNKLDSLYQCIPQRCLPTEYGGEAGPIQDIIDDWEKQIVSIKSYISEMDSYAANERKRPSDGINNVDMGGTFRILNVD